MPPLPSMRHLIRDFLLSQGVFSSLVAADRLVFKAPPDVTTPFATIQIPGNVGISGDNVAWSPLVQVDGYCPASQPDADDIAWDIAAAAAEAFRGARNVVVGSLSFRARIIDLVPAVPDVSRGEANPLARALMRAELKVHNG